MKLNSPVHRRTTRGYALMLVLVMVACMMIVMGGTLNRTYTVAKLNDRNTQYGLGQTAAEAAVEKVYARMAYDFVNFGLGAVTNNLSNYRDSYPNSTEDPYWGSFQFSDAQGNLNKTYASFVSNYIGNLPPPYTNIFSINSPQYRIVSNASVSGGRSAMTNAAQVDVIFALLPLTTYAIFYNGLLEFSTCATMTVNGRVHANGNIYTGTGSTLTFNAPVTCTGTLSSPANNGSGPWTFPGGNFNGSPTMTTNKPTITVTLNLNNAHTLIDIPSSNNVATSVGQQQMYNLSQVVLLISNTTPQVTMRIQAGTGGQIPGADPSPIVLTTNIAAIGTNYGFITTNFPFLSLNNAFWDDRENKTNITTQIDLGSYAAWVRTNVSILSKFPAGSGNYPTLLYVADNRPLAANQQNAVRLVNGTVIPANGGLGLTVATPGPLYVWGNLNCTNAANLATTNTTTSSPCALMSDAITILSPNWTDANSTGSVGSRGATTTTIDAALITGVVPSTGSAAGQFSGGVHNLPRLLESWSSVNLWLNTSIVCLYNSMCATNTFISPGGAGSYYNAPIRHFSFDLNYFDPAKQPPGIPTALVPIRKNWTVPPPNTVTYNVVP